MEENKNQTLTDKIWDIFSSVKSAVVLFALIALTSIIGTIIEQNAATEKNIKLIGKLFGDSLAPTLYNAFDFLGFMDMYHSWWFVALLMLFASNLTVCSIDRLPRIWKLVKEPVKPLTDEQFKNLGKKELVLKGKPEKIKEAAGAAIKKAGLKPLETKAADGYQLYSERGNYTRLGVYITHLSILLILIGAIIGIFFGFKASLNLPEGETYSVAFAQTKHLTPAEESEREKIIEVLQTVEGSALKAAQQLGMKEQSLKAAMKRYGILPLGFSIKCNDFNTDFYSNSNMPKTFKSWLTIIENGAPVKIGGKEIREIEVNTPLKYKGVTFYQSSYGFIPGGGENSKFRLRVTPNEGKTEDIESRLEGSFSIPGTNLTGKIENFSPAIGFDQSTGRPFTYADQMNNPAVLISFHENNQAKYRGWILKRYPETWKLPEGHTVEFVDLWGAQYTGLQVRKDPGVWIVYLGCIVMSIGLYIAFFMSHKKIWLRLIEEKNNTRIIVAMTSNKNREAFERKIDKMITLLTSSERGGK
ncbi:MAG: cytochrome c biogenesis protein ResB [Thermodesulfovibrionales bacterium]|nr:cytochrome c biogenesis protein ResB [Thermodesulfovibrionales bacterium]